MKNMTKRIISFVLCLAMLVGLMPGFAFGAEAEGTVLDAAIFCSDVHGSTSDLTSVLGGVAKSGVDYSSIGFVGDTCLTVANTTSIVQNALGDTAISVMFSYAASHDTEDGADIDENWDYSGEVEGVSEHYLVYTIRETDMQNSSDASSAAPAFTNWYNGLTDAQKALPIFILSHRPLHDRRDDNAGAATWYDAISAAAESSDIVFFWAHNHTGDNSVDQAAYYVAKDGTETFTVYNGDTVVPNFTYMNAGYINANNQNPKRLGVATTVQITADSLIFQDYNSSGTYTGTYAHNVTVDREFAAEEEPTVNTVTVWDDTESVLVEVTALGLTGVTATNVYGENDAFYDLFTDHMAVDVALTGVSEGTSATYSISVVPDLDVTNLELYYVEEDGTLTPVEFKLVEDELNNLYVEFTSDKAGTFVYGSPTVPEGYTLTSLTLENIPTDVFLGTSLSLDETAKITATYTMEGAEDFVRVLTIYDYDYTNFSGFDVNVLGEQTVIFTFEGLSVTHDICVWSDAFADETTGVTVTLGEDDYGVTGATVTESENANVSDAIVYVIDGDNYVAYDIELTYADGYSEVDAVKTVTLPIPDGVTNPVVYYVSDDGKTVTNMNATDNGDGTVSFTTTHFSTYVLGDGTVIDTESGNATVEGSSTTTTEEKTVYIKVDAPVSGEQYLIVSTGTAGTAGYILGGSSVTPVSGTLTVDGTDGTYTYIETTGTLWTASGSGSSWTFANGGNYLGYTQSSSGNDWTGYTYSYTVNTAASSTAWTLNNSQLYIYLQSSEAGRIYGTDASANYYLSGGNSWSMSTTASNVYFYKEVTATITTTTGTVGHTYSVEGTDITDAVAINGQTVTLSSVLYDTPEGGTKTDITASSGITPTYEFVTTKGNPAVISSISGSTATLSGTAGTAVVKVTYASGDLVAWDEFIVTAAAIPDEQYTITMHKQTTDAAGNPAAGDEITAPITIKNIVNGMQDSVWAVVKANGIDLGALGDKLYWTISGDSIGTINAETGVITFNGTEGTATVTASFTCPGGRVIQASVTYSVTVGAYTVPEDGTDDFPEYPDPGAIRFDKHATAVGNFSETGIAQVELSMTGVPYGTDQAIDVVVMLDMTGSMSSNGMAAAVAAAKAFVEKIVKNSDGTYNKNRVAAYQFNSSGIGTYFDLQMISSDAELETALGKIVASQASGGTPFDEAASHCQSVLTNAKTNLPTGETTYNRKQFCVFMSDGGPTTYEGSDGYTYYGGNASGDRKITSYIGGYTSSTASSWTYNLPTEYYTDAMKADGVTVYTVGLLLQNAPSNPSPYSSMTDSTYDSTTDSLTSIGSHYYFTSTILKNMASDTNKYIDIFNVDNASKATAAFENIAQSILDAATDVRVSDKIAADYTMVFEAPNATVGAALPSGQEMYIEVKDYLLDPVYASDGATIVDYTRGEAASLMKLYLGKNGTTYYAASDANGTAYATPAFNQAAIGTMYYWTTAATSSGVSVTVDGTTYYFDETGISNKDEDFVADDWFNMASGAYASGNIITTDIVDEDTGDVTKNSTCNDLIIATPYFIYNASTKMLTWTAAKLSTSELTLSYFLYLDESGGYSGAKNETPAGTYETNEYAHLNYTNFQGTVCQQTFPVPQMTWNGAQVSYVFYLVNDQGQPVNRAGKVVPFSEAVYVTDVFTYSIVWNDLEQVASLEAEYLAENLVPDVYKLYDNGATYNIHVFEDEKEQNLNNHFIIGSGSSTYTTYVFNTKADATKYKNPATYAATSSYMCKEYVEGGQYTDDKGAYNIVTKTGATVVETGFDFSNTTVAFAVVWKPALAPDTVVVDFGLDVVIDVIKNDNMAAGVVGVCTTAPSGVTTEGTYDRVEADTLTSVDLYIDANNDESNLKELKIGTASVENLTSVRFSLDKTNGMQFTDPAVFYYESDVNYYNSNNELQTTSMYSKVTVIPATTIYYEDEFVTYEGEWETEGTASNKTQDQDRPGASQISAALDADNNYGYDAAYENMGMLSMDSAHKITVSDGKDGMASFDFYGTGFDVISMTDTTTGTIFVRVYAYNEDGTLQTSPVKSHVVDTYYGYAYGLCKVTYTYIVDENGANWVITEKVPVEKAGSDATEKPANPVSGESTYVAYENKWYTVDSNNPNALYQVPVMKISGLDYGKYKVQIVAAYDTFFDNAGDGSYDFYLDAIRIYDPTGNQNGTANDAYIVDGEGYPTYFEVRDQIIAKETFDNLNDDAISGVVFIDGSIAEPSIADYTSYGPNNELYLAPGQAIAFELNATATTGEIDKIQLALKSVYGSASAKVYAVDGTTVLDTEIATATDMYHDITGLKGKTVVIMNTGNSGVLSITNVKVTYTKEQTAAAPAMFMLRRASVDAALATMSVEEETVPETTVPEETVPEETIPEETVPETTVPEETEPEDTVPEETQPEENEPGEDTTIEDIIDTIGQIIRKLFGWIFG